MRFLVAAQAAAQAMFAQMNTGRFRVSFLTVSSRVFRLSHFLPDWASYRRFAPTASRKP